METLEIVFPEIQSVREFTSSQIQHWTLRELGEELLNQDLRALPENAELPLKVENIRFSYIDPFGQQVDCDLDHPVEAILTAARGKLFWKLEGQKFYAAIPAPIAQSLWQRIWEFFFPVHGSSIRSTSRNRGNVHYS